MKVRYLWWLFSDCCSVSGNKRSVKSQTKAEVWPVRLDWLSWWAVWNSAASKVTTFWQKLLINFTEPYFKHCFSWPVTCYICSSPNTFIEKYGITKQVKVLLTRTPVPGSASTASSFSSQVHNQSAHRLSQTEKTLYCQKGVQGIV